MVGRATAFCWTEKCIFIDVISEEGSFENDGFIVTELVLLL